MGKQEPTKQEPKSTSKLDPKKGDEALADKETDQAGGGYPAGPIPIPYPNSSVRN